MVQYERDLCKPGLGLSKQQTASIFSEIDVVIHNGSDMSHIKYYQSICSANIDPTRFLLSLCLPRNIFLHYVSPVGMSLFSGKSTLPAAREIGEGHSPIKGCLEYTASK